MCVWGGTGHGSGSMSERWRTRVRVARGAGCGEAGVGRARLDSGCLLIRFPGGAWVHEWAEIGRVAAGASLVRTHEGRGLLRRCATLGRHAQRASFRGRVQVLVGIGIGTHLLVFQGMAGCSWWVLGGGVWRARAGTDSRFGPGRAARVPPPLPPPTMAPPTGLVWVGLVQFKAHLDSQPSISRHSCCTKPPASLPAHRHRGFPIPEPARVGHPSGWPGHDRGHYRCP